MAYYAFYYAGIFDAGLVMLEQINVTGSAKRGLIAFPIAYI